MRVKQNKNINHLLNSEAFLPASSVAMDSSQQPPQRRQPNSLIKTVCNDCINGQQVVSRKQQ